MSYVICEQQRRRLARASAQSDQRLCCSLLRQYNISRFCSLNFKTLASFCGCAGQFVFGWSDTPEDTFCCVMIQMDLFAKQCSHSETFINISIFIGQIYLILQKLKHTNQHEID